MKVDKVCFPIPGEFTPDDITDQEETFREHLRDAQVSLNRTLGRPDDFTYDLFVGDDEMMWVEEITRGGEI